MGRPLEVSPICIPCRPHLAPTHGPLASPSGRQTRPFPRPGWSLCPAGRHQCRLRRCGYAGFRCSTPLPQSRRDLWVITKNRSLDFSPVSCYSSLDAHRTTQLRTRHHHLAHCSPHCSPHRSPHPSRSSGVPGKSSPTGSRAGSDAFPTRSTALQALGTNARESVPASPAQVLQGDSPPYWMRASRPGEAVRRAWWCVASPAMAGSRALDAG
jgi:hypothetical protein